MKKIEFGFSTATQGAAAQWEGIGIRKGLLLTDADYYGTINFEEDNYVVFKVTRDEYGRYPTLLGKFVLRKAIADVYPDGSGALILDTEEGNIEKQIAGYLNMETIRDKIASIDDVFKYLNGIGRGNKLFTLLETEQKIIATSVDHDLFEQKNEALKKCHETFSDLQLKLSGSKTY